MVSSPRDFLSKGPPDQLSATASGSRSVHLAQRDTGARGTLRGTVIAEPRSEAPRRWTVQGIVRGTVPRERGFVITHEPVPGRRGLATVGVDDVAIIPYARAGKDRAASDPRARSMLSRSGRRSPPAPGREAGHERP